MGYNNAVTLLNNICKNCYSNNSLGATARSQNLDDILAVTTVSADSDMNVMSNIKNGTCPRVWWDNERGIGATSTIKSKDFGLTTANTTTGNWSEMGNFWANETMNTSSAWKYSGDVYRSLTTTAASNYASQKHYWLATRYHWTGIPALVVFGVQRVDKTRC